MNETTAKSVIDMFEMANLRNIETGLPMVIWIKPKGNEKHGARIKVQTEHGDKAREGQWVTVTVENEPKLIGKGLHTKDFTLVSDFVKKNQKILLQFWNDTISLSAFLNKITRT